MKIKVNLQAEEISEDNPLTLEEQQKLLDDLFLIEALVVGYENYCKSIGKFRDAVTYIEKFMAEITNKGMFEHFEKKGGDA